jgi:hypothetical protein
MPPFFDLVIFHDNRDDDDDDDNNKSPFQYLVYRALLQILGNRILSVDSLKYSL